MVVHMLVPTLTDMFFDESDASVKATAYTVSVAAQIVAALILFVLFVRVWLDHFKFRLSALAVVVGVVGYVLWVWICGLHPERQFLSLFGWQEFWPTRTAFDPFTEIESSMHRNLFMVLRFTTLALIVPVAEELFLRGFLVRWIEDVDLKSVRFDNLGWPAILAPTVCSVLTHPEIAASIVWFSLVTWLMIYTKSFWNCVVAHMVTNLLLGIHVVVTGAWELW
ncbi:CAAX amino terminal protease self- immunity [Mariniblastus fucicola]|uniref:CAAX amino terminal protease self-immunity n=2 Tax=Mariniblastus fucicola TaxID=980251 RepID=A0A5B9PIU9_9BACT|nr:CAAX amino terminal protease self- immunity [Mariniblastus fucicola]